MNRSSSPHPNAGVRSAATTASESVGSSTARATSMSSRTSPRAVDERGRLGAVGDPGRAPGPARGTRSDVRAGSSTRDVGPPRRAPRVGRSSRTALTDRPPLADRSPDRAPRRRPPRPRRSSSALSFRVVLRCRRTPPAGRTGRAAHRPAAADTPGCDRRDFLDELRRTSRLTHSRIGRAVRKFGVSGSLEPTSASRARRNMAMSARRNR